MRSHRNLRTIHPPHMNPICPRIRIWSWAQWANKNGGLTSDTLNISNYLNASGSGIRQITKNLYFRSLESIFSFMSARVFSPAQNRCIMWGGGGWLLHGWKRCNIHPPWLTSFNLTNKLMNNVRSPHVIGMWSMALICTIISHLNF